MSAKKVTTKPSCASCPSLLSRNRQPAVLGKDTGADVCASKLIALGRPGIPEDHKDRLQTKKASNCESYGKTLQIDPMSSRKPIEIDVAISVPVQEENLPDNVSSCVQCVHYMPSYEVRKRFGWTSSMCTARGTLIMDDRLSKYARDCDKRSLGSGISRNYEGTTLALYPEYRDDWGKVDPMARLAEFSSKTTDPFSYPTEKPLSADAKASGVRAWRRVRDPEGFGPDVFLPIFDHTKYSEIELDKVPTSESDERPHEYVDHQGFVYKTTVMWTRLNMAPAFWGLPGTGKTEFLRHMAYLMALPFERVSITASTELEYLEGKMLYKPDIGTYFQYGRIPMAWSKPGVVCLDEANLGQPAVWQFLRPLTDNSRQLVIDANNGETIKAHKGCYLAFAMNPAWDPRNVGAMEIGAADGSRLMHLEMTFPPEPVEKRIMMRALGHDNVKEEEAKATVDICYMIGAEIRRMSDEGAIPITFGIRDMLKFSRSVRYFGVRDAMRTAVSNVLDPTTAAEVMDALNQFVE